MKQFMLIVQGSMSAPTCIHYDINLAITESKRLHSITGRKVTILQIVGSVDTIEVPVTKREVFIQLDGNLQEDSIPF